MPPTLGILWLVVLAAVPVAAQVAEPAPPRRAAEALPASIDATYLGNEGFLVEAGGRRVLIDALFDAGITGYPAVPPEMRAELEAGTGSFGGVSVALATHYHRDHFDPGAVARFLRQNPEAVFVSTPQARAWLEEQVPAAASLLERFHGVLPAAGEVVRLEHAGVEVGALNLHHGPRDPPVDNLGFVITLGGARVLHFGDTEAKMEDFRPYLDRLRGTDLALLPFWFLTSEWRVEMVRDEIRPRWIVAAHLPEPTAPASYFGRWQSYDGVVRLIREGFPEAWIPTRSGERYRFPGDGSEISSNAARRSLPNT